MPSAPFCLIRAHKIPSRSLPVRCSVERWNGARISAPPDCLNDTPSAAVASSSYQMLWELRAEPLPGSADSVLVEMRQVPGYLDFLAEIMPADVSQAAGVRACWNTTATREGSIT